MFIILKYVYKSLSLKLLSSSERTEWLAYSQFLNIKFREYSSITAIENFYTVIVERNVSMVRLKIDKEIANFIIKLVFISFLRFDDESLPYLKTGNN
jgi:hypothetical protein